MKINNILSSGFSPWVVSMVIIIIDYAKGKPEILLENNLGGVQGALVQRTEWS